MGKAVGGDATKSKLVEGEEGVGQDSGRALLPGSAEAED